MKIICLQVEPLMPQMTACLKDKSLVVRRTTLTTLIHLLQVNNQHQLSCRGGRVVLAAAS